MKGDAIVKQVSSKNTKDAKISMLEVAGVFVAIGSKPNSNQWQELLSLEEGSYIITNEVMETKIPRIFAAGDVHHNSTRQAITAAGSGATAVISAERFLSF